MRNFIYVFSGARVGDDMMHGNVHKLVVAVFESLCSIDPYSTCVANWHCKMAAGASQAELYCS